MYITILSIIDTKVRVTARFKKERKSKNFGHGQKSVDSIGDEEEGDEELQIKRMLDFGTGGVSDKKKQIKSTIKDLMDNPGKFYKLQRHIEIIRSKRLKD